MRSVVTFRSFPFNPLGANTVVVASAGEAAILDATALGAEEQDALDAYLVAEGLRVRHLLLTHAHVDHVFSCDALAARHGLGWALHRGDEPLLALAPATAELFGLPWPASGPPRVARWMHEGERIALGETTLEVRLVPGHSPGSVAFYCEDAATVVTGDALFRGSIGRTDLPGGDLPTLLRAIETELLTLPDETVVYPGHGAPTTIGAERRTNPFLT